MGIKVRTLVTVLLLLAGAASAAEAKSYVADRFDSRVEVMRGGALRITETVVFRFEGGPFKEVFRQLRTRDTDGIELVSASMDGVPFPEGDGPGTIGVRRRSRVEVRWRFAPVSDQTHSFELTYVMRGVVRAEDGADVLTWTAHPSEHKYRIDASAVTIILPASPLGEPGVDFRRVEGETSVDVNDGRILVQASELRSNGRVRITARMPAGSVLDAPPAWQQKALEQRALAPLWLAAAGGMVLAGILVLFGVRQGYDTPPHDASVVAGGPAVPDTLSPAEAGALVSNGSPGLEHAMATLFALAARGELTIEENEGRRWGQRQFTLTRRPARRPVAPHEQAALDLVFTDGGHAEGAVTLDKARSRLTWRFKQFRRALETELNANGLLDADRKAVRRRFAVAGTVLMIVALVVGLPLGLLTLDTYGAWPLLIPLAMAVLALVALICHSAHTPLSNEGLRRARYWRSFRGHLKDVAHDREAVPAGGIDQLLPFAVALGLADTWSKFLKKHRLTVPSWFRAAGDAELNPAFIAFVAYGGATHGGGAGAGAGGVSGAGGGASGAS